MNKIGDDIFNFEEYNAQSLVVRGTKMADKVFKKSLTDKIIGRVIFNKRLKGGEGYLITNNQHNKDLFNLIFNNLNIQEVVEIKDDFIEENKKIIENQHKEETLKINMNKVDEKVPEVKQQSKELVKKNSPENKRRNFDSESDSDSDIDFKKKMRQRSKEKQRKKYVSSSSESESESEPSRKKRSHKYSTPKSSKSYKHKRRHSYSDSSESSSSDSSLSSDSEDERIQKVIKRKSHKSTSNNPKIKIESEIIDSDEEDIVTLARRLRYVLSEVKKK